MNFYQTNKQQVKSGFGLIELMVSIGIMSLITGVIIVRQSAFNSATLLRGQAYEIALQIKDTQLTAVSAILASGTFRNVYGLYFNTSSNSLYRIFKDSSSGTDKNFFYDANEEFGKQGILDRRFEIVAIRMIGGTPSTPSAVSILFQRPNFDALFYTSGPTLSNASAVQIDISPKGGGAVRTIEVTKTGQISVLSI